MSLDVSVIVPVYNPGEQIERCVRSLFDQSLADDRYELILVDDGSTDGTSARLDELAAGHEHVRVEHIPNSGWPGKPRNIGLDMARGEFVYFVDNDDHLALDALERMLAVARRDDADIVIGKVVGRGRRVPRGIFRESRSGVTIEWAPLIHLLTPHKLFRRSLLEQHGIRFPEGRVRLEDHLFTLPAYFHANGISILADRACYYWTERGKGHASLGIDPAEYFPWVRQVLDVVVENTEPGPLRDRLLANWYRGKTLGRVGGRGFHRRKPDVRRAFYEEVRALVLERFDPRLDAWLQQSLRIRAHLLREGSFEALERMAEVEAGMEAVVRIGKRRFEDDGTLLLPFESRLLLPGGRPLLFERREDRIFWVPPELPVELPDRVLEVTDDVFNSSCELVLRSRRDRSEYLLPSHDVDVLLDDAEGGGYTPVITGHARIEPGTAAAGSPLPAGKWDVVALVSSIGFGASQQVSSRRGDKPYVVRTDETGAVPRPPRVARPPAPPSLRRRVARRLPRVLRRAVAGRRAAASG